MIDNNRSSPPNATTTPIYIFDIPIEKMKFSIMYGLNLMTCW